MSDSESDQEFLGLTQRLAIWSAASAIIGIAVCKLGFIPGIVAILLAIVALYRMARRSETKGCGAAYAGLIIGILATALWGGSLLIERGITRQSRKELLDHQALRSIYAAFQAYAEANNGLLPPADDHWSTLLTQTGQVTTEQFHSAWDRDDEPAAWYLPADQLTGEPDRPLVLFIQSTRRRVLILNQNGSFAREDELDSLRARAIQVSFN